MNIDNLFSLMSKLGINQSQLSAETGISTGNLSDWKKGRSMPTSAKLTILADYFNCSVDYLLGRTDEPNRTVSDELSEHEQKLIEAYRNDRQIKKVIDALLDTK